MEVRTIPISNPQEIVDMLNPNIVGEDSFTEAPATLKDIDRLYHTLQLQALRIDDLENRIRVMEGRNE